MASVEERTRREAVARVLASQPTAKSLTLRHGHVDSASAQLTGLIWAASVGKLAEVGPGVDVLRFGRHDPLQLGQVAVDVAGALTFVKGAVQR
jgi:hypothetical protein